ncbi:MAG: GNAT family N-acetyltransferase [Candidatus Cryptobacteroides sp.]|nr:GNAT family N-acetyltransferase [Bacteroidales bacterium]
MQKIIKPVPRSLLLKELTPDRLLRRTAKACNELYVVTGSNAPNVMREIGRLREIAFRNGGGGTGRSLDIDEFDTDPAYGYRQLVLWNPDSQEIIGGYRYVLCDNILYRRDGQPVITSSHMFHYSSYFIRNILPQSIELGRSFVSVEYQSSKAGAKSIFALDNLFDGIGALMMLYKGRMKYLIGKMTIYPCYPAEARDMILYFLKKYFGSRKQWAVPGLRVPVKGERRFSRMFSSGSYKTDYKTLSASVRRLGVNIPPLVNSYMNLSPSMVYFGTGVNDEFADVLDSGIMINFEDIYPEKRTRHIEPLVASGWSRRRVGLASRL